MLDREQVRLLFFRHDHNGKRKAQRVLRRLYERGTLKRGHRAGLPCYYTVDNYKQVEHRLGVNWAYCYLAANLKSWETLSWEYEASFEGIRADALAIIKNTVKDTLRCVFVEYDRGTEGDCSVVEKYEGVEMESASLFVVCEDEKRAAELRSVQVAIPMQVMTVEQIRGEIGE